MFLHPDVFVVDNKFVYPVDYQNDKHNVFDVNGVDTIHETAGSTTPLKSTIRCQLYLQGLHQSKTFSKNHHFDKLNDDEKTRQYKKFPYLYPVKMKPQNPHIVTTANSHSVLPKKDKAGFGKPSPSLPKGSSFASDSYRKRTVAGGEATPSKTTAAMNSPPF